jgi:FkbM family methyltransferase
MNAFDYHIAGDDYYYGRNGKPNDDKKAFEHWMKGALLGSVQCIYNVRWAYEAGIGVEADKAKAEEWRNKDIPDYYSDPQIHQDKWVESLFNRKKGGFFLDIGAADGVGGSNTIMLEKFYEWDGICIEPNPEFFCSLKTNRRATCVQACVGTEVREVVFRMAGFYGGIQDNLSEWHRKNWDGHPVIKMTTQLIGDILDRHNVPEVIDYISLDIEGGEEDILKSFPWDKYKVRSMTVEKSSGGLVELIESLGFIIVKNPFAKPDVNWELHCVSYLA